jgi:hypothetical protein
MPEAIFVPNFLSLELPDAELPNLELPNAEVPNAKAPDAANDAPIPLTSLCNTSERLKTVQSEQLVNARSAVSTNVRTIRRFITPEQLENIRTIRRFEGARLQPCRQSNKMIEGFSP